MKVFIDSLAGGYYDCLRCGFEFLGEIGSISSSDRVAIKPNLTFPIFRRGVMTNPEAIHTIRARSQRLSTAFFTIGDSSGA